LPITLLSRGELYLCQYRFCLTPHAQGFKGRDAEDVFVKSLEGVFDAVHIPELKDQAEIFARKLSCAVFDAEIRRIQTRDSMLRRSHSALLYAYLDALPHALARENVDETTKARELVTVIIQDLVAMGDQKNVTSHEIVQILHQIASRFSAMCLEDSWERKSGGCSGIRIMTRTPDLGVKWINDCEVELVRTLLHVLKDLPYDLPRDVDDVLDVLTGVLRVSNIYLDPNSEGGLNARSKTAQLIGITFSELSSPSPVVRRAAQTCIELMATLSGKPVIELLLPHRERMLAAIYTKPLRALAFPLQIGMIEAIRYCVSLDPPLAELNDELLRLLHETLALADAEETNLLGRANPRQGSIEVTKLRVACIKLLTASMPMTDFFSKQHQTRQRLLSC
jgi:transformation/transcription domain-associated protein